MAAVPTSIRYQSDGKGAYWHIPFPYAHESAVAVNLIDGEGRERRLTQGAEYIITDHMVVCIVPPGWQILIWLDGALAANMPTARAAPVYDPATETSNDNAAAAATLDALARARSEFDQIQARLDAITSNLVADTETRLLASQKSLLDNIAATARQTATDLARAARLEGATWPMRNVISSPALSQGAIIPCGLAYYNGRNDLSIFHNGRALYAGLDYEETGAKGEKTTTVRLLTDFAPGDWLFRVEPTNIAQEARQAATDSAKARQQSIDAAHEAQSHAAIALTAENEAENAKAWAAASQKSADAAYDAQCRATDMAWQISIHHKRPGIACLKSLDQLECCAHGTYLINPNITHAPSIFMGIWGVPDTDSMQWEGVFFIGDEYPCNPVMPPLPPKPAPELNPDSAGNGDDWLPCGHSHNLKACNNCQLAGNCGFKA